MLCSYYFLNISSYFVLIPEFSLLNISSSLINSLLSRFILENMKCVSGGILKGPQLHTYTNAQWSVIDRLWKKWCDLSLILMCICLPRDFGRRTNRRVHALCSYPHSPNYNNRNLTCIFRGLVFSAKVCNRYSCILEPCKTKWICLSLISKALMLVLKLYSYYIYCFL